jgi:hypothetical protein
VLQRLPRHGPAPQGDRGDERRSRNAAPAPAARATSRAPRAPQGAGGGAGRPARQGSALLFTSGYVSNWAALSTLGSRLPNAVILSDELNHASMIEGIRHSRCHKVIWKHNDPEDLDRKLAALPANATKIVAFESVYSMDGDIARSRRSSRWRKARRDDLSRRGARGGHVWPARRRRVGTRGAGDRIT